MNYTPKYRPQFAADIKKYSSMKKQIEKKVLSILENPYYNTEPLENRPIYNLMGIRSKRIDRNFRILFSICEECRDLFTKVSDAKPCTYCDKGLPDNCIIFFVVRPHKKVYKTTKPVD
jgi:Txe/YoeB family toxin of Txe-Axe toxin-antitoxin module